MGNSTGIGEFPAQRPVTRSFGVPLELRLNKRLSKQSWDCWFQTPSRPLWRHRNDMTESWRNNIREPRKQLSVVEMAYLGMMWVDPNVAYCRLSPTQTDSSQWRLTNHGRLYSNHQSIWTLNVLRCEQDLFDSCFTCGFAWPASCLCHQQ